MANSIVQQNVRISIRHLSHGNAGEDSGDNEETAPLFGEPFGETMCSYNKQTLNGKSDLIDNSLKR